MTADSTHALRPGASFYLSAGMLLFGTWYLARSILAFTGGQLIYGLDDPYIHLAIAQNLLDHGVFGVAPDAVTFASSSLLWPLLLAGLGSVVGALGTLPLLLNVLGALGALWMVEALFRREGIGMAGRFAAQLLFLVMTPMIPVIFTGMEHTLHLFSILLVIYLVPLAPGRMAPRRLAALAAAIVLAVLVRYESILLGVALGGLFLFRRDWHATLVTVAAAALPVIVAGLIMIGNGGYFLSNSLLVKGPLLEMRDLLNPFNALYYYLLWPENQAIHWREVSLVLFMLAVLFVLRGGKPARWYRPLMYTMLGFVALHMLTVRLDQFSRYTAYVVGSGLVVALLALFSRFREIAVTKHARWERFDTVPLLLAGVIALWPLLMHGMSQARHVPAAARNIYEQQFQLGRFMQRYYRGERVALNDLGAITYYGRIRPVDLVGLGEPRVAIARRHRLLNTDTLRSVTADYGARIAVLYPEWFPEPWSIPDEWIPVGDWILRDNIVCGGDTVRFYGLTTDEAVLLRSRLEEFVPELPARVGVRMLHTSVREARP